MECYCIFFHHVNCISSGVLFIGGVMKRIFYYIVFVLVFFFFTTNVSASDVTYPRTRDNLLVPEDVVVDSSNLEEILKTPCVDAKEKIYDFADLYTDSQEKRLYEQLMDYIHNTDVDAAIVTTKDLLGFTIREYAYHFYDYNGFADHGVLFVIYIGTYEPQIFMANSGPEDSIVYQAYTNERIAQILEYVYRDVSLQNYYRAMESYIHIIKGFFHKNNTGEYQLTVDGKIVRVIPWGEMIILSLAVTFLVIMVMLYQLKGYKQKLYLDTLEDSINKETLRVKTLKDDIFDTKRIRK